MPPDDIDDGSRFYRKSTTKEADEVKLLPFPDDSRREVSKDTAACTRESRERDRIGAARVELHEVPLWLPDPDPARFAVDYAAVREAAVPPI